MLRDSKAYSGFSVRDIDEAHAFYRDTLGLNVTDVDETMGMFGIHLAGGGEVFVYAKPDHEPATFTILNFPVDDVDSAIDELIGKGVTFERYDNLPAEQDGRGVLRGKDAGMGPNIAWFKDPSDNVLSLTEE